MSYHSNNFDLFDDEEDGAPETENLSRLNYRETSQVTDDESDQENNPKSSQDTPEIIEDSIGIIEISDSENEPPSTRLDVTKETPEIQIEDSGDNPKTSQDTPEIIEDSISIIEISDSEDEPSSTRLDVTKEPPEVHIEDSDDNPKTSQDTPDIIEDSLRIVEMSDEDEPPSTSLDVTKEPPEVQIEGSDDEQPRTSLKQTNKQHFLCHETDT
ncbi:nucleosome assembly protein 1-like 3 isoform X2 [Tribolium madens]|uniref:nucleosome assembly protein 1-like 3 isoform X2 n=1 Tax=Tribolium madens TaxID=41895 RepID=UPI001CF74309|nr:nucleosome assembly protein 1-like 3 isoform X2 [Tribolium madens]